MTSTDIANASKIMLGSTEAVKMYIGGTVVWEPQVSAQYDCEIEYLDGNGSQYIDLNVIPDENTGIYIKAESGNSDDRYIVGLRNNTGNTRWCIAKSNSSGWYYGYGGYYGINVDFYSNSPAECKLNYLADGIYYAENSSQNSYTTLPTLSFSPAYNIRLFGSSGVSADYTKFSGKLYFVKISQGSDIIMDLIPVRVGQMGYMYDKISGQLFGNSGTGDFVLGPDKQ